MNEKYYFTVVLSFVRNCRTESVRWSFEASSKKEFADEFLKRFGNLHNGENAVKSILRSEEYETVKSCIQEINKTTRYNVTLIVDAGRIIIK